MNTENSIFIVRSQNSLDICFSKVILKEKLVFLLNAIYEHITSSFKRTDKTGYF